MCKDDSTFTECLKSDGTPRTTYVSVSEANVAILMGKQYGQNLIAYTCRICAGIHVRPKGTPEPSRFCVHCRKYGYANKEDAALVAKRRYWKDRVRLDVYSCPYTPDAHLTKAI